jgi:hypothetical protein
LKSQWLIVNGVPLQARGENVWRQLLVELIFDSSPPVIEALELEKKGEGFRNIFEGGNGCRQT